MIDGGLWSEIDRHVVGPHWQRIETGGTGRGIPDLNGCLAGVEVWMELKTTTAWNVVVRPEQVGWAERRGRSGGRVFLVTRRRSEAGPKKGSACDELFIHHWRDIRNVVTHGLGYEPLVPLLWCDGGPAKWDWREFEKVVFRDSL